MARLADRAARQKGPICGIDKRRSVTDMTDRLDQFIATLNSLAKDPEARDLIATTIHVLDTQYDLARKMAKESGIAEIIKQLLGRLDSAFESLSAIQGNRILDIACGSNSSKAPASIHIDTPFGNKQISPVAAEGYTALFEPWFCRVLLPLGAYPVGIDFGELEGEAFEHYRVDLGQIGALDFLPSHAFDAVQDSRLFGSPEFKAQFPDPADRLKIAVEIRRQEQRLLKASGRIIHSDAETLVDRSTTNSTEN